jgi:NAD(P)-dependent dehydrogenase (short-subunit alcohol dehydrogenase family)
VEKLGGAGVVVIVGASSGLGRSIGVDPARQGARFPSLTLTPRARLAVPEASR